MIRKFLTTFTFLVGVACWMQAIEAARLPVTQARTANTQARLAISQARTATGGRGTVGFTDNLVFALPLEETGTSTRRDRVSNVTMTNTGSVTQGTGIIGNCSVFASASSQRLLSPTTITFMDYGRATAQAAPAGSGETMMCWVNATTMPAASCPMSRDSVGANRSVRLGLTSTKGQATYSTTGSDSIALTGTTVLTTGTWHHLATVLDTSIPLATLYVDGVAEATSSSVTTLWVNVGIPVRIGCRDVSSDLFNGSVDEAYIWTRALTAGEVLHAYNAGVGITFPFRS